MNAVELRYRVTTALSRMAGIAEARTVPPVPGEPLTVEVIVEDPYVRSTTPAGKSRRFKITVEEID